MLVALTMHTNRMPFNRANLNMLETHSIISASVTLYCGLFYLSDSLEEITKIVFFILILGVNIKFFVLWVRVFLEEFRKKIHKDQPGLYAKTWGKFELVKEYLKFDEKTKCESAIGRISESTVLDRQKFFEKNLSRNFRNNQDMTDRQFAEIVSNKGKMTMSLLKTALFNDDNIFHRSKFASETEETPMSSYQDLSIEDENVEAHCIPSAVTIQNEHEMQLGKKKPQVSPFVVTSRNKDIDAVTTGEGEALAKLSF